MNRVLLLIIIFACQASAENLTVIRGAELEVCNAALNVTKNIKNRSELRSLEKSEFIDIAEWKIGQGYFIEGRPYHFLYGNIDIDNDGIGETVTLENSSIRGGEYNNLYVYKNNIDFSKKLNLTTINRDNGIYRDKFSQFQYANVSLASLLPFAYKGRNYVMVFDENKREQFGEQFPVLVIEYMKNKVIILKGNKSQILANDHTLICVLN